MEQINILIILNLVTAHLIKRAKYLLYASQTMI